MRGSVADEAIQNKGVDCHETANAVSRNDKMYKRFCFGFAWAFVPAILGFVVLLFLLWLYDPFWFFHKPYFREQTFMDDRRLAVKGMVDFMEFDSAIFGSSMLENTLSKEADEKIGGKWLNLAINSSRIYEREVLLLRILKRKKIKQIIYALENYFLVKGNAKDEPDFKPLNLSRSFFQNFNLYLSNEQFISCALKWSKDRHCVGRVLNTYARWYSPSNLGFDGWSDGEKQIFLKELPLYENNAYKEVEFDILGIQTYLKEHILHYVAENPQIKFHFILPTQSRFFWKLPYFWNRTNVWIEDTTTYRSPQQYYNDYKTMLIWLVQECAKYENVKIYGFDDLDYADNLDNYTDARHYNVDMNSMQLDAIANGTHILTPKNIDEYLQTMENKIKAYDLTPLINEIKAWETEQNATAKE